MEASLSHACLSPVALVRFLFARGSLDAECLWVLMLRPRPIPPSLFGYLETFFLTCLLEAPIYGWSLRRQAWSAGRKAGAIVLLNLATHPFIYLAVPRAVALLGGKMYESLLFSETFAPLVEGAILWRLRGGSPLPSFLVALIANLLSWWFGIYLV